MERRTTVPSIGLTGREVVSTGATAWLQVKFVQYQCPCNVPELKHKNAFFHYSLFKIQFDVLTSAANSWTMNVIRARCKWVVPVVEANSRFQFDKIQLVMQCISEHLNLKFLTRNAISDEVSE